MSRGGHNWKGGGTVEGTPSLEIMELARAGLLAARCWGTLEWSYRDGTTAQIRLVGGRYEIMLHCRVRVFGGDWEDEEQRVPIRWTPCRFGGGRPWFVCDVRSNGVHCGRQVAKLYGAGRLFACRHCYRLGYASQRGGPMDRAHLRLAKLHRRLEVDYLRPGDVPVKPKWMRWRTYQRVTGESAKAEDRLNEVFMVEAQRLLTWTDKRRRMRR